MSLEHSTPHVIAVSSGKGGVGKTFISTHLAQRAVAQGLKVLLVDADLGLANVDVMLGISTKGSIKQMLDGDLLLADMVVSAKQGFDVFSGDGSFCELSHLTPTQQRVMLDEMHEAAKDYDLVLIDTGAGIGENVLYFISAAESTLIVLTPDPNSLRDAYALIKVLSQKRDVRRFMVAVNQVDESNGRLTFRRLLSLTDRYLDVHLDYVGHMIDAPQVREAIQKQTLLNPSAAPLVTEPLYQMLNTILSRPRDSFRTSGLQFFWQHSLGVKAGSIMQAGD